MVVHVDVMGQDLQVSAECGFTGDTIEPTQVLEIVISQKQSSHVLKGALPKYGHSQLEAEKRVYGVRLPAESLLLLDAVQ